MEKNKRQKLLFEGLKSDEIELLKWYRENPLSVYIEISLRVLDDIGIITEEQHRAYQAQAEENAGILRKYSQKKEEGSIIDKDALKDFLFDIMNEHDEMFADISLDDGTDTIYVRTVNGDKFIVMVSPVTADEALIELWTKKNPELMSLALGVLNMRDLGDLQRKKQIVISHLFLKRADNFVIDYGKSSQEWMNEKKEYE